ncbi:MAG: hypothetical protein JWO44_627 [Bacteroidetes bacterium]|nr:hypothetical protein [Bacteroidota bacterium]
MKTNIRKIINRIAIPHNHLGGLLFCIEEMRNKGIPRLIDNHLGARAKQSKYKYSDIILSWIYSTLSGAHRLEDTKKYKQYLDDMPDTKHPSPDRIGFIFKSKTLVTENTYHSTTKADHEFNVNMPLNSLMVDIAVKLGQVNCNASNVLDYDNVVVKCRKYDAKRTYKKYDGYAPGVAFIGKIPVYVENRNGNSNAKYRICDTVKRCFELLKTKKIKIKRFRSDNAAYSKEMLAYLDSENVEFFIRARNSHLLFDAAFNNDDNPMQEVWIGDKPTKITSINYEINGKVYRVVVTKGRDSRRKKKNKYSDDDDTCRAIITNADKKSMSDKEVVIYYNQRGSSERNFTCLNDFNWERPPFSFLNENTVFFILSAMGSIVYQHLTHKFSKKVPFVNPKAMLKHFIDNFITVALEWVVENNHRVARFITSKDYAPLFGRPPSPSK